ncbi:TolC family outer membrane protein [Caballeronia cordobensis]|uniref:TolC family outer membrane protein n=1 Tax=Caballeronia cordobensis TaxID=1353886 RepID=UPI00045EE738|nr:TolC family type I secretion outer membrane protein [Burkholderia sp. RPE67]
MRNRSLTAWSIAGCLLIATCARAEDLAAVVEQTLEYDSQIAQARANYEASKQAVPIARAALLPQISGGWGRAYNRIDVEEFPRQTYWQSGWMVNISQPIFDWTKWTAYQQADFVVAQGAVGLADARQAAMLRAIVAYFEALSAEDELKRTNDYLAAIDAQLDVIRRKRAAGETTVIDVQEAGVAREQAQLQRLNAEQDLAAKRRAVEQVSGRPFSRLAALPPTAALPPLAGEGVDVWADQARSSGFTVQAKQLEWEIAKMESKKVRAAHYPVVNVTGSYTPAGAASGYARPTTTTTGMLSVMIPLFSGGEIQARLRQTLALEDKAQEGMTTAMRDAEAAARDDHARYARERARSESLGRLVRSSRDTLSATEIGYKVGSRTSLDVLRALDTLYSTQRDFMRSRYDAIVALLKLKADAATLGSGDIAQVSSMLSQGADVAR